MKNSFLLSLSLFVLALCTDYTLPAQVTFSRFDFNSSPFTTASIGPNAISIDPDVVGDGAGVYINANCAGTKGIDLTIPNLGSLFDQPEMGMTFRFRKFEARADFFVRGGTSFFQSGNDLWVGYRTTDGMGGTIDYGPYNTNYILLDDFSYHEYTFIYIASSGIATVSVDGLPVWSQDGPDNRDFDWTAAPDPIVGSVMDGNCSGASYLDYAFFFIPPTPLPVEFLHFSAESSGNNVDLAWITANETAGARYVIDRSQNGLEFAPIANVNARGGAETQSYAFTDPAPGIGRFYYRIRLISGDGGSIATDIQTAMLTTDGRPTMQAWPNPVTYGVLNLSFENLDQSGILSIYDLRGRLINGSIGTNDIVDSGYRMNVSNLVPGIYLLKCECGTQPLTEKFIVR